MTLLLALLCFFAAAIAIGVGALVQAVVPTIPGWLLDVIRLGALLVAIFWLRAVLGI